VVSKTVGSLTANTTYRFAVRNKWSSGTTYSDFSNTVEITTPAEALPVANDPSNLNGAVTGSGNLVALSWTKNGGDAAQVFYSYDGVNFTGLSALGSGVVSYTHSVGYDTHVWYKVRNTSPSNTGYTNTIDLWTQPDVIRDPECVTLDTLILVMILGRLWLKAAGKIEIGDEMLTVSPQGVVSVTKVKNIARGTSDVIHVIHTDQGQMLKCSPSHPIIMGLGDTTGRPARRVKIGDTVLVTDLTQRQIVEARVDDVEMVLMEKPVDVVSFELEGKDHTFVADGIVTHNLMYKY
jgi:hypothetical protein